MFYYFKKNIAVFIGLVALTCILLSSNEVKGVGNSVHYIFSLSTAKSDKQFSDIAIQYKKTNTDSTLGFPVIFRRKGIDEKNNISFNLSNTVTSWVFHTLTFSTNYKRELLHTSCSIFFLRGPPILS